MHDASQACDCVLEKNRGYRQSILTTCSNLVTLPDAARAPPQLGSKRGCTGAGAAGKAAASPPPSLEPTHTRSTGRCGLPSSD